MIPSHDQTTSDLHVVLGAAGGTGSALVAELRRRGIPTRVVTRRPSTAPRGTPGDGVERVAADLSDPEAVRRAVAGASVVYHAANPPYHRWLTEFPALNAAITTAVAETGALLVFADNLYCYGPGGSPMREDTPLRATDKKGLLRIRLASDLLEAHAAGRVRVTIGRSSDYFGPDGLGSAIGEQLFGAVVAGKAGRWLGSLEAPHSVAYLPDIAAALVTLGTDPAAPGRVWHVPSCGAPTGREFRAAIETALGAPVRLTLTSARMVRLAGVFSPRIREVTELMYQWEAPFVSDASSFLSTFGGATVTPLDQAVATTVAWFRARATDRAAA